MAYEHASQQTQALISEREANIALRAESAKLKEALLRMDAWAKAYPLDIFPRPDLKKAAAALKTAGMTLDSISADNMRYVLDRVKDIVSEALEE